MIILYDNVPLAAGGAESVAGLRITHVRSVQGAEYIRARFGAQFPRRNIRHEITFQVTRLHKTLREAMSFLLDHPQSLPDSGLLTIIERETIERRRWIRDAVLVRADLLSQLGVTTVWGYQLVGGEILDRDPRRNPSSGLHSV